MKRTSLITLLLICSFSLMHCGLFKSKSDIRMIQLLGYGNSYSEGHSDVYLRVVVQSYNRVDANITGWEISVQKGEEVLFTVNPENAFDYLVMSSGSRIYAFEHWQAQTYDFTYFLEDIFAETVPDTVRAVVSLRDDYGHEYVLTERAAFQHQYLE